MSKKFNHAFDIAFELVTDKEDPCEVTPDELIAALRERIKTLQGEGPKAVLDAVHPFDSYEFEE